MMIFLQHCYKKWSNWGAPNKGYSILGVVIDIGSTFDSSSSETMYRPVEARETKPPVVIGHLKHKESYLTLMNFQKSLWMNHLFIFFARRIQFLWPKVMYWTYL